MIKSQSTRLLVLPEKRKSFNDDSIEAGEEFKLQFFRLELFRLIDCFSFCFSPRWFGGGANVRWEEKCCSITKERRRLFSSKGWFLCQRQALPNNRVEWRASNVKIEFSLRQTTSSVNRAAKLNQRQFSLFSRRKSFSLARHKFSTFVCYVSREETFSASAKRIGAPFATSIRELLFARNFLLINIKEKRQPTACNSTKTAREQHLETAWWATRPINQESRLQSLPLHQSFSS